MFVDVLLFKMIGNQDYETKDLSKYWERRFVVIYRKFSVEYGWISGFVLFIKRQQTHQINAVNFVSLVLLLNTSAIVIGILG